MKQNREKTALKIGKTRKYPFTTNAIYTLNQLLAGDDRY